MDAETRRRRLEAILRNVLASAHPNPVDQPVMAKAWADAHAELAGLAALPAEPPDRWQCLYCGNQHVNYRGPCVKCEREAHDGR